MKVSTPLALALAVLCVISDPVVAASKTSEAGINVRGPLGQNSIVPVAGTDSLIAVVIITAFTNSQSYDCQRVGLHDSLEHGPGLHDSFDSSADSGDANGDSGGPMSSHSGNVANRDFGDWWPPGVPRPGDEDTCGPHILHF